MARGALGPPVRRRRLWARPALPAPGQYPPPRRLGAFPCCYCGEVRHGRPAHHNSDCPERVFCRRSLAAHFGDLARAAPAAYRTGFPENHRGWCMDARNECARCRSSISGAVGRVGGAAPENHRSSTNAGKHSRCGGACRRVSVQRRGVIWSSSSLAVGHGELTPECWITDTPVGHSGSAMWKACQVSPRSARLGSVRGQQNHGRFPNRPHCPHCPYRERMMQRPCAGLGGEVGGKVGLRCRPSPSTATPVDYIPSNGLKGP